MNSLQTQALQAALHALEAIGDEMTVGERYTNAGQYLLDALPLVREALAETTLCECKDRPLSQCPGTWEPGCDMGNNEAHAASASFTMPCTVLCGHCSHHYGFCAKAAQITPIA